MATPKIKTRKKTHHYTPHPRNTVYKELPKVRCQTPRRPDFWGRPHINSEIIDFFFNYIFFIFFRKKILNFLKIIYYEMPVSHKAKFTPIQTGKLQLKYTFLIIRPQVHFFALCHIFLNLWSVQILKYRI